MVVSAVTFVAGFRAECKSRIGSQGSACWERINTAFDHLPLAGFVCHTPNTRAAGGVLVVHGGIGGVGSLAEIDTIEKPLSDPTSHPVAQHLIWSDPAQVN